MVARLLVALLPPRYERKRAGGSSIRSGMDL
jgi:hypothetical protein